jgi:hypothetical protein
MRAPTAEASMGELPYAITFGLAGFFAGVIALIIVFVSDRASNR